VLCVVQHVSWLVNVQVLRHQDGQHIGEGQVQSPCMHDGPGVVKGWREGLDQGTERWGRGFLIFHQVQDNYLFGGEQRTNLASNQKTSPVCWFGPQNQVWTVWCFRPQNHRQRIWLVWSSKLRIDKLLDTWWNLGACVEAKQSQEGTRFVGSLKKNLDGFTPRGICAKYFM
jgi:hypothetical protein